MITKINNLLSGIIIHASVHCLPPQTKRNHRTESHATIPQHFRHSVPKIWKRLHKNKPVSICSVLQAVPQHFPHTVWKIYHVPLMVALSLAFARSGRHGSRLVCAGSREIVASVIRQFTWAHISPKQARHFPITAPQPLTTGH